jgi:hypothetical protein
MPRHTPYEEAWQAASHTLQLNEYRQERARPSPLRSQAIQPALRRSTFSRARPQAGFPV